jgi:hypothetical protein
MSQDVIRAKNDDHSGFFRMAMEFNASRSSCLAQVTG